MLYQSRLIDLLDRKFNLINGFSSGDFLLELENFIHFTETDEMLSVFTTRLIERFRRKEGEHNQEREKSVEELVQIRDELIRMFPDLDDSEMPTPSDLHDRRIPEYDNSFANFDRIVSNVKQKIREEKPVDTRDHVIEALIGILQQKLDQNRLNDEVYQNLTLKLRHIGDSDIYLRQKLNNYRRVSSEASLLNLYKVVSYINPVPRQHDTFADLWDTAILEVIQGEFRFQQEIQQIIMGQGDNEELINRCKVFLRRVYEGIRTEIGSNLIHYEALNRYKARCTWYDRQRLQKLGEENEGNEEDIFTRDLALYLFDNGISTLYRVQRGEHEYDLIGHRTETPIFVEAKVYKTSRNTRRNLTSGIAQLHSYLNSLEAENLLIEEAYYVIYRLGGPLYDLPWKIPTNRRVFYPIIIDLGPSRVSGRRQPRPIQIPLNEFFDAIVGEEAAPD